MAAVGGENGIVLIEGAAYANRTAFLSDTQMDGALDMARHEEFVRPLLEAANPQHGAVHLVKAFF